jgi:membrane protein DedA with SNARE-associated domain
MSDGSRMREFVKSFLDWYLAALDAGGYPLITFLMALESSIVPLPSEVVIPPAAYVAHTRGTMSLAGIVVAGTVGSWLGATAMYWAARLLGRPLLMRYGRYLMVTPEKIEQAEIWSARFGAMGIFISRLLPVIRHLIGIPAGIVRMDYLKFSAATVVGSGLWCSVLAWVGVTAGQDQQLLAGSLHRISVWVGGLMLFIGALYYFFVHRYMRR